MAGANRKPGVFVWAAKGAAVVMVALYVSGCVFQDPGPHALSPSAGPSSVRPAPPSPAPIAKLSPMDYLRFLKQCETQRQQIDYHLQHDQLGEYHDPREPQVAVVSSEEGKKEEKTEREKAVEAPSVAEHQYTLLIDKFAGTQAPPTCEALAASYDKVLRATLEDLQNDTAQAEKAQGGGKNAPLPAPTRPSLLRAGAAVKCNSALTAFYKQHPETPHDLRKLQIPVANGEALTW